MSEIHTFHFPNASENSGCNKKTGTLALRQLAKRSVLESLERDVIREKIQKDRLTFE
ncbi:MAG: hypothetical protein WC774_04175 [Candidatus Gracilibacteria bacterium]